MKAEIIAVSNDLLNGKTHDKNIAYLAHQFTTLGIEITRSTLVADAKDTLRETIQFAEKNAELIVLVGGLGPDESDITKETLSKHLDVPLILDQEAEDKIITYHNNSNFVMPDNNQMQALVLYDSTPIHNETGLAVGMFYQGENHSYLLLPGPFDELKPTYEAVAAPLIKNIFLKNMHIKTRILRVFGLGEAELNKKLEKYIDYKNSPMVGIYEKGHEYEVQITVGSENKEEAEAEVKHLKAEILDYIGPYVYAETSQTLLRTVKDLLNEHDLTVTAAESLTGGGFLSAIASEPEASSVLTGGMVTYSTEVKNQVLGVSKEVTDKFGVISAECAIDMANKAGEMFKADIAVGLTGVAGPSSLEGEIPGTVWIGIAQEGKETFAKKFHFAYKRNDNRQLAVLSALNLVRLVILEEEVVDTVSNSES